MLKASLPTQTGPGVPCPGQTAGAVTKQLPYGSDWYLQRGNPLPVIPIYLTAIIIIAEKAMSI